MIFLDTGYLVALLDLRDQLHARALAWAGIVNEPLVLTEYVLWECVNYFSAPIDRPKAHALVNLVTSEPAYELITASPRLFASGIQMHAERQDKFWSLTDCISFFVMHERGIHRALAYDHHFEQAGFEALLRRDPP